MADVELWDLSSSGGYLLYTLQRIDVLVGFDISESESVTIEDGTTEVVDPSYAGEFGYDFQSDNWQTLTADTYESIVAAGVSVLCRLSSIGMFVDPSGKVVRDAFTGALSTDFEEWMEAYGWASGDLGEFELVMVDKYFILGPDEIEGTLSSMVVLSNQYTDGDSDDTILYYPAVKTKEATVTFSSGADTETMSDFSVTYEYEYHAARGLYTGYYYTTGLGEYRAGQVPDPDAETGTYATSATEQYFKELLDLSSAVYLDMWDRWESARSDAHLASTSFSVWIDGSAAKGALGNPIHYIDIDTGTATPIGPYGSAFWDPNHIYFFPGKYVYSAAGSGATTPAVVAGRYETLLYDDTSMIYNMVYNADAEVLYWPDTVSPSGLGGSVSGYDLWEYILPTTYGAVPSFELATLSTWVDILKTAKPPGTFPYARGHGNDGDVPPPFEVDMAVSYAVDPSADPEQLTHTTYQGHRLYTAAEYAAEFEVDPTTFGSYELMSGRSSPLLSPGRPSGRGGTIPGSGFPS